MLDLSTIPPRHSADVRIELVVSDQSLPVAETGSDYLVLADPIDLLPCEGEVVMTVDGRVHRWRVRLVFGSDADDPSVFVSAIE